LARLTASGINSDMRAGVIKAFILNHLHESSLGDVQRARILLGIWMGTFHLVCIMDLASGHDGRWVDSSFSLFLLLS